MAPLNRFWKIFAILGWLLAIIFAGFFIWQKINLDSQSSKTYYKIFNKDEILKGDETTASEVISKLDKRLNQYHRTFEKMVGKTSETKLKALFYMNFVHMFGIYGKRDLKENTFQDLLWGGQNFHCGTNTLFLAMLLDKAGYEFRTVSTNNGSHGFVEIKFDNRWQILDPTINTWIDKSTEELIAGAPRQAKKFFLKAGDQLNEQAQEDVVRVINVKDFMLKLGIGYKGKIDNYNYMDLSHYQY